MQKGSYEICISDQAAFQVQTANLLKRSLKEIYALGGDYVSVLLEGSRLDGSLPEISGMNMSKRGVREMYLQFPKTPERLTPAEQRILEFIEGNREEFLLCLSGRRLTGWKFLRQLFPVSPGIWAARISKN